MYEGTGEGSLKSIGGERNAATADRNEIECD